MTITSPLTREAQAVRDLLASLKDIIGDDEDFAADIIEGETNFLEIVNALVAQDGEDHASVEAIQLYIDKLSKRALNINARIERRRAALLTALQTAGITKPLRCPLATVGLRAVPPKVVPTDEKLIPDEYWRKPPPVLDKRGLLAALKGGATIPGACLSNGGVALSIRMA
jgi:hypothetical protein